MADITIQEIKDLKTYFLNDLYGGVRGQQEEDLSYYNDTFAMPEIQTKYSPLRSGLARRIIDSPSEQMVTRNPQAFITCKNEETTKRFSTLTNHWLNLLRRQNPNPFKESVKNPLLLGETFLYLTHNEEVITKGLSSQQPIIFIIPDPMTIYASIEEDENGIPDKVIISCDRNLSDIKYLYPEWKNPKNKKGTNKVSWLAYFDKHVRYFEADEEAVLEGEIQQNIYGFTPFIRRYSGYGRRDANENLVNLIVGELRGSRGLLREECLVRNDISSALRLWSHPGLNMLIPQTATVDAAKLQNAISFEPGMLNVIPIPEGGSIGERWQLTPVPEVFNHLREIQSNIIGRHPLVMAGTAISNSGRQDDQMGKTIMHRYETILENDETMWATGLEKALGICKTLKYTPEGLNKEDLEKDFSIQVVLRAEDPLDRDRLITLGDRLWNGGNGSIDLTTNHTKYQGLTQQESDDIQAQMLVDKLTLQNPDVAMVMGMMFAEESGMDKYIKEAQATRMQMEQQQKALQKAPTKSGEQRIKGETMTESGFNVIDQSLQNKGARTPPSNYQRGA